MNMRSTPQSSRAPLWKTLILGIALIVNCTLLFRLVWGQQSLVSYRELSSQYEVLTKDIAEMDAINAGLSREIRLLQSDEKYVEKMIRRRLNFVRDNEILYLFNDGQDASRQRAQSDDGKN